MITWTESGAVEQPRMVQIRVQRAYPGRVRAGAPVPTRSMSQEELLANLTHFTSAMRGTRSQPCDRLVLSGVGVASRADTPHVLSRARELGMQHIVLHVGAEDLEGLDIEQLGRLVDTVVLPVQPGEGGALLQSGATAIRSFTGMGLEVVANTVLSPTALPALPAVARSLSRVRPNRVAFTYPFPISGGSGTDVSRIAAVVHALQRVLPMLGAAGIGVSIKGLPACYLPKYKEAFRKSANRWYVDADHQLQEALLFFPDVVAFSKSEACRFCEVDAHCDGFFATYLRRQGFPALRPFTAPQ